MGLQWGAACRNIRMGDSFRSAAWDSQLDNMLDDLQQSVQSGHSDTSRITNGHTNGHSSHEYQEREEPGRREVMERSSRSGGGPAQGFSYQESSSRHFTQQSSSSMGAKRAGGMEQAVLTEKRPEADSMRARSDSLVSDLSSIAKVRSVSRSTHHSTERYETTTTTSNTQQSIKKNINDLDNLLNNLSTHSAGPSRGSSKPASREGSPGRRMTRTEERRERLISSASAYRTPSQSRPHSPGPGTPSTGRELHHQQHQHQQHQEFVSSTLRSQSSAGAEFRPVHTTPDPLTGRYADGRITPNHGFTRTFASSPALPRKATVPSQDLSIPKKPDE